MPEGIIRKITLKEFLKGMWLLVCAFLFLMLHVVQWLFCGVTFVPFIFPLLLYFLAGFPLAWWLAGKWRNWLNRVFEMESVAINFIAMLFVVSWIPPALLLSTNYLLADNVVVKEKLPVVKRGESYSRNATYYWVKIEKHGVRKKVTVGRQLPEQSVDSVVVDIRKGCLGFEFFEHPDFILRSEKK